MSVSIQQRSLRRAPPRCARRVDAAHSGRAQPREPSCSAEGGFIVAAGDILDVEVVQVAVFGLFCRAGKQEVLVLIPETSWVASYCSCQQFASPGDWFRVRVLHDSPERDQVSASIRALHPDPWPSGRLAVGTRHQARVVRSIESADRCCGGPGHLLELLPGAFVVLGSAPPLEVGQVCSVVVVASDFSKRAVHVAIAERPHATSATFVGRARQDGTSPLATRTEPSSNAEKQT